MPGFPLSFDEYGFWIDDEGTILPVLEYQGHEEMAYRNSYDMAYARGWIRGYLCLKCKNPMPSVTFTTENISQKAMETLEEILKRIPAEDISVGINDENGREKHYHTDKPKLILSFIKSVVV